MKPPNRICMVAISNLLICGSLTRACLPRHVTAGPIVPPAARQPPDATYQSNLVAQTYGTVIVSGGVTQGGMSYNNSTAADEPDKAVSLSGSTQGNEDQISCGDERYHRDAESIASAQFHPEVNESTRTYGFGLTVSSHSRGGEWKHHAWLVSCGDSSNTSATANAHARGEIRLTFNAISGSDKLVIQVTGKSKPQVTVLDVNNRPLTLSALEDGNGQVADLPVPGPYTVTAELTDQTSAYHLEDKNDDENTHVSVQSMRDALNLGYGGAVNQTFKIPLPIRISASDLKADFVAALFDKDGKFYPCKQCDGASHIYLQDPQIDVSGGWVVLHVTVGGGVGPFDILGVHGGLTLYGAPSVQNNIVSIDGLVLEVNSESWVVQIGEGHGLEQKLLDQIKAAAKFDLAPKLKEAMGRISTHFPVAWEGACLLLEPPSLQLDGIYTIPEVKSIEARFIVGLKIGDPQSCRQAGISKALNDILDRMRTVVDETARRP
jgi:hypothetical protein